MLVFGVYTYTCVYMYVYIYVYICTCIYIYIFHININDNDNQYTLLFFPLAETQGSYPEIPGSFADTQG